jgi:hypothetical protein
MFLKADILKWFQHPTVKLPTIFIIKMRAKDKQIFLKQVLALQTSVHQYNFWMTFVDFDFSIVLLKGNFATRMAGLTTKSILKERNKYLT